MCAADPALTDLKKNTVAVTSAYSGDHAGHSSTLSERGIPEPDESHQHRVCDDDQLVGNESMNSYSIHSEDSSNESSTSVDSYNDFTSDSSDDRSLSESSYDFPTVDRLTLDDDISDNDEQSLVLDTGSVLCSQFELAFMSGTVT